MSEGAQVDRIAEMVSVLPPPMRDPVLFAVPFFVILLAIEWAAARKLGNETEPGRPGAGAYLSRDARASVLMGLVSVLTMGFWKFLGLLGYAALVWLRQFGFEARLFLGGAGDVVIGFGRSLWHTADIGAIESRCLAQ